MDNGYENKNMSLQTSKPFSHLSHKIMLPLSRNTYYHDDVIKWKHFLRYWPFLRGIHRSPVNFPHKGQWRGALTCSLICVCINGWVNNREAGDLRRYRAHHDVIVMTSVTCGFSSQVAAMWRFDFFDGFRLNKPLKKQSSCRRFDTPRRSYDITLT